MQSTDGAHSAVDAFASSTNIIQFFVPRSRRRLDRHEPFKRQPQGDWPHRSGRRKPELVIALAICKAMTAVERGRVLSPWPWITQSSAMTQVVKPQGC